MKTLLFIGCLPFVFISSCSNSIPNPEVEKINYRDYFYPLTELATPRVYCYISDSTKERTYDEVQCLINGSDTMLVTTSYDSLFRIESIAKEQITPDSSFTITFVMRQYDSSGKSFDFPINYTSSAINWQQTLTDSNIINQDAMIDMIKTYVHYITKGHFEKVRQPIAHLKYGINDLVALKLDVEMTTSEAFADGKKLFTSKYIIYYARNVGKVYEIFSGPLDPNELKSSRLDTIISIEEFNKLKLNDRK